VIIIWFFVANSVIEDPESVSLIYVAWKFFRACGYPEKLYRNSTVDPKGRVCFPYPGEAIFCYCSVTKKIIETRL